MTVVGTPSVCPRGGGDCLDTNDQFHPGAVDECAPGYVDYNCDGVLNCAPITATTSGTTCEGWTRYCDTLLEGEAKRYSIGESSYDVSLAGVSSTWVRFVVNGNTTGSMIDNQVVLISGREFQLTDILYQDYAGGIHQATFCIR